MMEQTSFNFGYGDLKGAMKWGRQYHRGDEKGYEELAQVLQLAYFRASKYKGKERHASNQPFIQQEICQDLREFGITPALFQARKKTKESVRLPKEKAIEEMLDAIVYLAAAVIVTMEDKDDKRRICED